MTLPIKEQLVACKADLEHARKALQEEQTKTDVERTKVRQFNTILHKILRAADGLAVDDDARQTMYANSAGFLSPSAPERSEVDLLREQIEDMHARITGLECRLASVRAVTQFAVAHKG